MSGTNGMQWTQYDPNMINYHHFQQQSWGNHQQQPQLQNNHNTWNTWQAQQQQHMQYNTWQSHHHQQMHYYNNSTSNACQTQQQQQPHNFYNNTLNYGGPPNAWNQPQSSSISVQPQGPSIVPIPHQIQQIQKPSPDVNQASKSTDTTAMTLACNDKKENEKKKNELDDDIVFIQQIQKPSPDVSQASKSSDTTAVSLACNDKKEDEKNMNEHDEDIVFIQQIQKPSPENSKPSKSSDTTAVSPACNDKKEDEKNVNEFDEDIEFNEERNKKNQEEMKRNNDGEKDHKLPNEEKSLNESVNNDRRDYPCDQGEYKATQKCNLSAHLESKHTLFPSSNWNEDNSKVLRKRFEKTYGIKEGVFETPLAIMKTLNYGFPDLTKTNKVGVVDDDPLNSLLPPGPGLVKVYGQPVSAQRQRQLDAEPGRGEIVIEPKRGIKRSASRERTLLETMKKPRKETKTEDKRRGRVTSQGRGD